MSAQAETKAFLTTHGILKATRSGIGFSSYNRATTTMDEVLPGLFDTGVPDVKGLPDLSTLRLAPWEPGVAFASWIGSGATALRTRFARARS